MKFNLKLIPYLVIAMLLVVILLQRECNRPKPCPPTVIDTIAVIHNIDTLIVEKVVYKPKPVYVYDSLPDDTVWYPVTDSVVIADYYRVRDYDILLRDDTAARLSLTAKVYMNTLLKSELRGDVYQKHTTIVQDHYIQQPPGIKIYAGFQTGAMLPDKFIFAPSLALNTKRDHLYMLGYDPVNKMPTVTFLWKISLSRHPN
jgi:hypothetical protein